MGLKYLGNISTGSKDVVNVDYLEENYSSKSDLFTDGKIKTSLLPSYVDDVLEYANLASFPSTGETGKIYVALDTNLTYRWSGSGYVEISPSLALGETASTAYAGDKGAANASAISTLQGYFTNGKANSAATADTATNAQYTAGLRQYIEELDLNSRLAGGGAFWYYGQGTPLSNFPEGFLYGGGWQLNTDTSDNLALQLVWCINHNSTNATKDLWFRVSNNLGWHNDWKVVYHSGNSNKSDVDWRCNNLTANGNVGIGTTSPQEKLDVNGYTCGTGFLLNQRVSDDSGRTGIYPANVITGAASVGDMALWANGGRVFTWGNLLMMNGNIGIGTTSPSAKLDVSGTSGWTSRFYSSDSVVLLAHNDGCGLNIGSKQSDSSHYLINAIYGQSILGEGGTSAFYVRADGNVGIGTTSPSAKLHLYNGGNVVGIGLQDRYLTHQILAGGGDMVIGVSFADPYIKIINDDNGHHLTLYGDVHVTGGIYSDSYVSAGGQSQTRTSGGNTQGFNSGALTIVNGYASFPNELGITSVVVSVYKNSGGTLSQVLTAATITTSTITLDFTGGYDASATYEASVVGTV